MDWSQVPETEKRSILATVQDSPVALLLLQEMKELYNRETDEVVQRGVVSDEVKKDFRYHLGQAETCRKMLKRVNEAVSQTRGE